MVKNVLPEKSPYISRIDSSRATLWKRRAPLLTHLDIEITERCNLNCIHCHINRPANDKAAAKEELTTAEIKDLLEQAAALGCLSIRFTGGEPLLRRDFSTLYVAARNLGMKVSLFTNATLLSPRLSALFAEMPPLEPVEITLYGMKKASYEAATRTHGSFEAARRGMDLIIARKIPFALKYAVLPPNREEIGEFERWAAGIPTLTDAPSYALIFNLRARRDSAMRNAAIKRLRLPPEKAMAILVRDPDRYRNDMRPFCSRFMNPDGVRLLSCGAGKGACAVGADGFLRPCLLLRHPDTIYNLRTGALREALTRFFPEVRKIKSGHPEYLRRCAQCFLRGLCEQCPAKSWTENGTLDTPVDYLCDFAHTQARQLGLIDADERAWMVSDWKNRLERLQLQIPGAAA